MNAGKPGSQGRRRWADRPNTHPSSRPHASNEDDLAMQALLGEATARARSQEEERGRRQRPADRPRHQQRGSDDSNDRYRRSGDKRVVEDDRPSHDRDSNNRGKRRRWNDREESMPENPTTEAPADAENPNKVKANFGLSGALAKDTQTGNVINGVTLKFSEPPEARIPNTRWRLYVFRKKAPAAASSSSNDKKDDGLIDTYHISRQSAYLFGRERKVADIPVDHPSLSKQHAVLQYRALPARQQQIGAPDKLQCKPYLMDLESTNGTFINGVRLDPARYYELKRGDVITLGASSREYVLLTEQSAKTGI